MSRRIISLVGPVLRGLTFDGQKGKVAVFTDDGEKVKRALELLREAYPDSEIEVKKTNNPYAEKMIVMDMSFVAWIESGTVTLREAPLLEELVEKKEMRA